MCNYSQILQRQFCRRPAMVGDVLELVLVRGMRCFAKRRQRGTGNPWLPTCIRPGTEVAFEHRQVLPQCHSFIDDGCGGRLLVNDILPREARFAVVPGGLLPATDGLEFSNGLQVGLSAIEVGARLRVLQLPAVQHKHRQQQQQPRALVPNALPPELVPVR